MNALAPTPSSPCAAALPGSWTLAPGRAISLRPRQDGLLQVLHGSVWVTSDGPHAGPLNDLGDRVVAAGQALPAAAGVRLVLESLDSAAPASFDWTLTPPLVPVPAAQQLREPWCELRLALGQAGGAALRLLAGLAALGWSVVAPRPAAPRRAPG